MNKSGIYKIWHTASGRIYIGSATNIERRWDEHVRHLRSGKHANAHLQNAWNKYGQSAFLFEVVELCGEAELLVREQHYLDTLDNLFNIALVAASPMKGRKWGDVQRSIRSAQQKERMQDPANREQSSSYGNSNALGNKFTPDQCARLKATKSDPAWRAAHSERMKAFWAARKAEKA